MPDDSETRSIEDLQRYRVGGAVRDKYLDLFNRDSDWVVVGSSPQEMVELGFKPVGNDFPVFLHPQTFEEHALARRERKVGPGYKGFEVETGDDVSLEEDLFRRDLTINAMAETPDGELIDPYGGLRDIENRTLRHVSEHFAEDPLRVLRVARFAARFNSLNFEINSATWNLMRQIVKNGEIKELVAERVWQELKTGFEEGSSAVFMDTLFHSGVLSELIPEFDRIIEPVVGVLPPVYQVLLHADKYTHGYQIQFALLMYYGLREKDSAEVLVTEISSRLKAPNLCRELSKLVVRHADQMAEFDQLSPKEVVELIGRLDGMRKPLRLTDFVTICHLIDNEHNSEFDESYVARDKLISSLAAMMRIDHEAIAKKYERSALRQRIFDERVNAVTEVLEQFGI